MEARAATKSDIPTIVEFRKKLLREVAGTIPENLPDRMAGYLENHLPDGTCLCVILEEEGRAVASAMLCIYDVMPDEVNTSGKVSTLFNVYTLPEHRGAGLMQGLLHTLFELAKRAGVEEVYASAEEKAIPLYRRMGFLMKEREMHLFLHPLK